MVYVINANNLCPVVLGIDNNNIVDLIYNELNNASDVENFFNENSDCIEHECDKLCLIKDEDIFDYIDAVFFNSSEIKEDRFTVMFFRNIWWVRENKNQSFKLLDIEMHEEWDENFRCNISAFARYMLFADKFAYYCFHAISRKTDDNGLKKNSYLNNWAYSDIQSMVSHMDKMVKYCMDNNCRLYAGVNARSTIKAALAISNDMTGYINIELDNGSTYGVQGLRKVFSSVSQRVISRHPKNTYKFYMLDVDFKDEPEDKRIEVLRAIDNLLENKDTVKFLLKTTHGFHIVTTYTGGQKYNEFKKAYGQYVDVKKDPIVFIGNFS